MGDAAFDKRFEILKSGIFFALWLVLFFISAYVVMETTPSRLYGDKVAVSVYALIMASLSAGFLMPHFALRHGATRREVIAVSLAGLCSTAILLYFVRPLAPHLFLVFSLNASLGAIGAIAHTGVAEEAAGSAWSGRLVGGAYCAALVAQYVIQRASAGNQAVAFAAAAALACAAAIFIGAPRSWVTDVTEARRVDTPYERMCAPDRTDCLILIAIVALMSVIMGLSEGITTNLDAHSKLDTTASPRLLYAAAIAAAGCIADWRSRSCLTLSTLCMLTLSSLAPIFLRSPRYYNACLCSFYLYCGFYVFYITIVFMDLAPRTRKPELWAPMGRVVRSAAIVPALLIGPAFFASHGELAVTVSSIVLLAVVIFLVLLRDKRASARGAALDAQRRIDIFADRYALNGREIAVLRRMLESDEKSDVIAAALEMAPRTCQRAITSIYEKTGTNSRTMILIKFHGDLD